MKTDLRELRISGGTTVVPSKTNTHHGGSSSETAALDAFEGASGRPPHQQPATTASALAAPQQSSRSPGPILTEIPAVPENRRALHAEPTSTPKTPGVHLRTLYAEDQETKIADLFRVQLEPGERSVPFEGEMLAFVLQGGGKVRHGEAFKKAKDLELEYSFYLPRGQEGQLMAGQKQPMEVLLVRICKQLGRQPGNEIFMDAGEPDPAKEPAPDGSEIFLAVDSPIKTGGLAIAKLAPGQVSVPVQHSTLYEMWYVLEGVGDFVQPARAEGGDGVRLERGTIIAIMPNEPFQFRCTGSEGLRAVMLTVQSWPGSHEATRKTEPEFARWLHEYLSRSALEAPEGHRGADLAPADTHAQRCA